MKKYFNNKSKIVETLKNKRTDINKRKIHSLKDVQIINHVNFSDKLPIIKGTNLNLKNNVWNVS